MNDSMAAAHSTPSHQPPLLRSAWIVTVIGDDQAESTGVPYKADLETKLRFLNKAILQNNGEAHLVTGGSCLPEIAALEIAENLGLARHLRHIEDTATLSPQAKAPTAASLRLAAICTAMEAEQGLSSIRRSRVPAQDPQTAIAENNEALIEISDFAVLIPANPSALPARLRQLKSLAEARGIPVYIVGQPHRDQSDYPAANLPLSQSDAISLPPIAGLRPITADLPANLARPQKAAALKSSLSAAASHNARWFRNATKVFFFCNIGTAVLAAASALLPHETWGEKAAVLALGVIEFALLVYGLNFKFGETKKRRRTVWTRFRLGADIYRSVQATTGILDPLWPLISPEKTAAGFGHWRRYAISIGLHLNESAYPAVRTLAQPQYLKRLKDQIDYYANHAHAPRWLDWWHRSTKNLVVVAALTIVASALLRLFGTADDGGGLTAWLLRMTPVILPLLVTVPDNLRTTLDFERRELVYPELRQKLAELQDSIQAVETPGSFTRHVLRAESLLVEELKDWCAATIRVDPN